jgi:N-methylhydantoinase A
MPSSSSGLMCIDAKAATTALGRVADELGLDEMRGAFGVHDVVNENMAGAARVAISERGRVPQEYTLLATGGAAPVHAWHVGRKLGVRHVVCPLGAGAGSTIGMLMAPARIDRVASFIHTLDSVDWDAATAILAGLEQDALAIVAATGAEIECRVVRRLADMRYVGQGFEVTVALPETLNSVGVRTAFEASYRALFGRTPPGAMVQFVALRLSLTAPMPGASSTLRLRGAAVDGGTALKGWRDVYFPDAGGTVETAVYDRYALPRGTRIAGPAVFEENESTFVVGPSSTATVLPDGSILTEMPN